MTTIQKAKRAGAMLTKIRRELCKVEPGNHAATKEALSKAIHHVALAQAAVAQACAKIREFDSFYNLTIESLPVNTVCAHCGTSRPSGTRCPVCGVNMEFGPGVRVNYRCQRCGDYYSGETPGFSGLCDRCAVRVDSLVNH